MIRLSKKSNTRNMIEGLARMQCITRDQPHTGWVIQRCRQPTYSDHPPTKDHCCLGNMSCHVMSTAPPHGQLSMTHVTHHKPPATSHLHLSREWGACRQQPALHSRPHLLTCATSAIQGAIVNQDYSWWHLTDNSPDQATKHSAILSIIYQPQRLPASHTRLGATP